MGFGMRKLVGEDHRIEPARREAHDRPAPRRIGDCRGAPPAERPVAAIGFTGKHPQMRLRRTIEHRDAGASPGDFRDEGRAGSPRHHRLDPDPRRRAFKPEGPRQRGRAQRWKEPQQGDHTKGRARNDRKNGKPQRPHRARLARASCPRKG